MRDHRAEYKAIRFGFMCEDGQLTHAEFDARARALLEAAPKTNAPLGEFWVWAAKRVTTRCGRCAGTGSFVTGSLNGRPVAPGGICFRCAGKGFQTYEDTMRNDAHDRHYMGRATA